MSPGARRDVELPTGDLWDDHASWWRRTFTHGADLEYEEEILPLVAAELASFSQILDLGCGEGHVARRLAGETARRVVGIDRSGGQLANAREEGGNISYVHASAETVPFAAGSFDAVVCCLVIEHVDNPDVALEEAVRVLRPGGCFLLLVNHPMYQGAESGFVDDQILGEHYWRVGPYLQEGVAVEQIDGEVAIPFAHRPLSRYINPLAAHDFVLTKMLEPPPLPAFLAQSIDPALEGAIPRLLAMRFEHRPPLVTSTTSPKRRGARQLSRKAS